MGIRPEPKRNSYGQYVLPLNGEEIGWQRATTFANKISDTYNLTLWKQRCVAVGVANNQGLASQVAVCRDPNGKDKKKLNELIEKAMEKAGAGDAADLGSSLHTFTEEWDTGAETSFPQPYDADIAAYDAALKSAGIKVLPEYVERVVSVESLRVAGTLDRLFEFNGELFVADVKGLDVNTPLPTPTGWTTMGAVQVGDEIFGSDGKPCRVTLKSPIHHKDCYRIVFDDGSSVVADFDHRWLVESGEATKKYRTTSVLTTEEIAKTLRGPRGQRQHRVALAGALELPDASLPIDPYVLGAWLGDGDTRGDGIIHKPDSDLWAEIERRGFETTPHASGAKSGTRRVHGLRRQLIDNGLAGHKFIPTSYLRASRNQRLDLLRGLMDTDGTWNKARNEFDITLTNKELILQVKELILSLGVRVSFGSHVAKGFGVETEAYSVKFFTTEFLPFISKADRWEFPPKMHEKRTRRLIQSVERTVTVPTQCIMVDSPDHTYLCTEDMIPTHNTGKNPVAFPHEICIQLSVYANADTMYEVGTDGTGVPIEMPKVNRDRAIVMHLPPGSGQCSLYWFDIKAGWEAAQLCDQVKKWHARKGLVKPLLALDETQVIAQTKGTEVPASNAGGPVCSECGSSIDAGFADLSMIRYGVLLCPEHYKARQ